MVPLLLRRFLGQPRLLLAWPLLGIATDVRAATTCAICHGQWVMVSAGILAGRKATAVWNIHTDLANAGAIVLDEPCVVDGNLITARFPYDLPRMIQALVKQLVG